MKKKTRAMVDRLLGDVSRKDDINQLYEEFGRVQKQIDSILENQADAKERAIGLSNDAQAVLQDTQQADLTKYLERDTTKPAFLLMATHDYGNIGDLAINHAERVFLRSRFADTPLFVFSRQVLLANWQLIASSIQKSDVIFIHGGGNMGDIWLNEERARRAIIKSFPNNKIISLPQSVKFFDDKELKKSQRIYNAHSNLLLLLRDDASMEFASKHLTNTALFRTEDIVMSYQFAVPERLDNENVLFLERHDREKGSDDVERIRSTVHALGYPNYTSDTVLEGLHAPSEGIEARLVYDKIDEIHAARLVVTNRLHGAIFALLAGRPVIVVDNNYGKIAGALQNISKKLGSRVVFVEADAANITAELIDSLYKLEDTDSVPATVEADAFNGLHKRIAAFIKA